MLAVKPEGADDFPQMHRLVWAFAARMCDRYHNLMNWLISWKCHSSRPRIMMQSNYTRFVRLCVHYLGNHEPSQDLPYVVSWGQQDTPRSAKQFVKMFHLICLNLGIAVITTFIELFTLRKPKLIFNYIKQNVRKYLEFDLVWACWVFIHFKLYVSEQRDPDEIAQTHMLSWALS